MVNLFEYNYEQNSTLKASEAFFPKDIWALCMAIKSVLGPGFRQATLKPAAIETS